MATIHPPQVAAPREQTRFFFVMALVMALVIVGGFTLQLAMGRSSFAVPAAYHLHAAVFMGWIGIYLTQHVTALRGQWGLHAGFGRIAYLWIPLMLVFGSVLMVVVARRTGGPFFFHVSEFLWSNMMLLWCFGGLAFWALRRRRYTGWHRRLMLCAMAILTGPGLGRILPLPLMIPHAWTITTLATMVFPVIGMIADKRATGRVHPAYLWGLGIYAAVFVLSLVLAHSETGMAITRSVIADTPGELRPMEAFLPPGFTM
ncbi:hypothetical protein GRI55_01215 [Erythrobacter citreus]|uniref:Uncharacterized protein n=1 Tax=Qipengyuania citrea TaxID=225971 RepID=A0A6I4U9C5_9SPHN|nr:hypothetical protein [Qipengyuania citrea]MDQ0566021.1 hypothetical protein [Qipengyuania citrea]MXP34385.1 hypothetical protein [Qipengyuania citrea]